MPTALLLGVGYCARALLPGLKAKGYRVIGTTRRADKAQDLSQQLGIDIVPFDGGLTTSVETAMRHARIILSSIPPNNFGDPVIQAVGEHATSIFSQAEWVGYLSATSVYGNRGGQWVYEDEPLYPTTQRGRNRIEAELNWLETGARVHVFRLAGIYGPKIYGVSRNPFQRLREGKARAVIKPGHVVNRIHVEDIARAVLASIDRPNPASVYNLADDEPATPQDVINHAADLLNVPRPPEVSHNDPSLSDMMRSFYGETKRVSNERAKHELEWTPHFPNYRVGLARILDAESST